MDGATGGTGDDSYDLGILPRDKDTTTKDPLSTATGTRLFQMGCKLHSSGDMSDRPCDDPSCCAPDKPPSGKHLKELEGELEARMKEFEKDFRHHYHMPDPPNTGGLGSGSGGSGPSFGKGTGGSGGGGGGGGPPGGGGGPGGGAGPGGMGPGGAPGGGNPGGDPLLAALVRAMEQMGKPKMVIPMFSGDSKQNPASHLLRAEDWLTQTSVPNRDWPAEFRHTLDGKARIWYNGLALPRTWDVLKEVFTSQYSHLGRNSKQLWDKWKSFTYTPDVDDIESFLYDIKETCKQLNMNDEAALGRIKAEMPKEVYWSLYNVRTLAEAEAFLKEQFGRPHDFKPAQKDSTTLHQVQVKQVEQKKSSPPDALQKTDILNAIRQQVQSGMKDLKEDWSTAREDGDSQRPPVRRPFKPWGMNTPRRTPRRGGLRMHMDRGFQRRNFDRNENRFRSRRPMQRGFKRRIQPSGNGGRPPPFGGYDRSPTNKKPKVASKTVDKDRFRCRLCHNLGHWARDCPEKDTKANPFKQAANYLESMMYLGALTHSDSDSTTSEDTATLN